MSQVNSSESCSSDGDDLHVGMNDESSTSPNEEPSVANLDEFALLPSTSHLSPGRLLFLSNRKQSPTLTEAEHIRNCSHCQKYWVIHQHRMRASEPQSVPSELWNEIFVEDLPVGFRDGSISMTSWQFGLLRNLRRTDHSKFSRCIELIVDRLVHYLRAQLLILPNEDLVIATYGQIVLWCAHRAARVLSGQGYRHVSVVPVHGSERMEFGRPRAAFAGARIVCLSDVAHTGRVLRRMQALAQTSNAIGEIQLVAFVRLTGTPASLDEFDGLWVESPHRIMQYERFSLDYPSKKNCIRLYEPELGIATESMQLDEAETTFLCNNGCLRLDAVIEGNHYLLAIDTLKLLGIQTELDDDSTKLAPRQLELLPQDKVPPGFSSATAKAVDRLCELALSMESPICLIVHEQKLAKAGRIAEHLSLALSERGFYLPVVRINRGVGCDFNITAELSETLASYRSAIIVDSVMRTGATLSTMSRAVAEAAPHLSSNIAGLVVVASSRKTTLTEIDEHNSLSVESVMQLPMLPPTESFHERTSCWKRQITMSLNSLNEYCEIPHYTLIQEYSCENFSTVVPIDNEGSYLGRHSALVQPVSSPFVRWLLRRILTWRHIHSGVKASVVAMLIAIDDYSWLGEREWLGASQRWLSHPDSKGHWRILMIAILSLHLRTLDESCPASVKHSALQVLRRLRWNFLGFRRQKGLFGDPCWQNGIKPTAFQILLDITDYCTRQGIHAKKSEDTEQNDTTPVQKTITGILGK